MTDSPSTVATSSNYPTSLDEHDRFSKLHMCMKLIDPVGMASYVLWDLLELFVNLKGVNTNIWASTYC